MAGRVKGEIPDADAPLDAGTEIKLHGSALIPDDYLPNISTRLVLYKRIAKAEDAEAIKDIQVEMIDRFGLLPDPVKLLFDQALLRVRARALGIVDIDVGQSGGKVKFDPTTPVPVTALIGLLQREPKVFKLADSDTLRFTREMDDVFARKQYVEQLMGEWETACAS